MKTKFLMIRKMQIAFGSAILTLLGVGMVSYRATLTSSERDQWVRHTHEVLDHLKDLLSAMENMETNYRGFVLTGNEAYLELYRADVVRVEQNEKTLRALTADDPDQQRQCTTLESWGAQKIQFGEMIIRSRRTEGAEAAAEVVRAGQDQRIMDQYRMAIREMEDHEQQLLLQHDANAKRRLQQTNTFLILGTVLGILIAAVAGWSVQHGYAARVFAEEARQESEERYRMLVGGVQDYAIFLLDPRGRVVSWNAGAERIKGYQAEEIIGRNFSCFYSPEDIERGRPEESLRMTAASGRHEEEVLRVRKDGSRFWADVTFTALRDTTGNLCGFSEISRDLSERKATEAKYRGLLEAAPDAMVVVNQDGEIVLLNLQAEKQFGYHRDELVGQKIKNIIPEGFAERLITDGTRTAAEALAQQIGTGIELTGRRKNGSEFPIEIMLSPLESPEGILVTTAIRDITDHKRAEKELARQAKELARSNAELQQFAYVASHDLQEPLRMVASYTQLLAKRYKGRLDSDADEFIAYAVDGAHRMQRLIGDLLAYCRVGTAGMELRETSSGAALEQALLNLQEAIEKSGGVVTHDPLPTVVADGAQLVQLFQNVVANAIKYRSAELPRVHVSAKKNGGNEWIFSLRDNGMGIDPKYFEKIFVMFQRLHDREEFSGTGIGLTVCKKIAERHGGRMWVESEPGKGSTFYFALPERG